VTVDGVRRRRGARRRPSRLAAFLVALAAVVADQAVKALVRGADALPIELAGGFRITLFYNRGVSFSRLAGLGDTLVVLVGVLVGVLVVAVALTPARYRLPLGLMLGGAAGNLVDRLRYDGAVLDFLDMPWWPAFNLADVFIVAGTAWTVLVALRGARG
jgi:signal peptidase II